MAKLITPTTEELGRRRFPDGAQFLTSVRDSSERIRQRLLLSLASNYSKDPGTNLGVLYTAAAEEFSRLSLSLSNIHEDRFHDTTRPEYLYQILGDNLFLAEKSINPELSGEEYRSFLIKIRNAYFGGSRKKNMEEVLSDILGITVVLTEVFEEAKKPDSIYSTKDTNKLFFDVFMDGPAISDNIGLLIEDLVFFVNLIRPAHVLYKNRFIWNEDYDINRRKVKSFGRDATGITPDYDFTSNLEVVLSLDKLSLYTGTESDLVDETWVLGTILSIDVGTGVITLTDGKKLVIDTSTTFYDRDTEGDFRIDLSSVTISAVKYLGYTAPGSFNFYNVPTNIQVNPYTQYNPSEIDKPYFQENVKKTYEQKGRFENYTKELNSTIAGIKVSDALLPQYEDMRDSCELPSAKPVSDVFYTVNLLGGGGGNLPAHLIISNSPNIYTLTKTPVLGPSGELAVANDLLLFINGAQVFGGIESVDVLSGVVVLNFLVPSNTKVQINYWFSKKYPVLIDFEYTWFTASTQNTLDDLPAFISIVESGNVVKRLAWPFIVTNLALYGQDTDYQLSKYPILDRLGNLATVEDVKVYIDGLEITGAVEYVRPLLGHVGVNFIPPQGAVVKFVYYYTSQKRTYAFVPDNLGYPSDAVFGNKFPYTTIIDATVTEGYLGPLFYTRPILTIGYRWRAFDLSSSSVLNSKNTLVLNGTVKEFNRSTVKNSPNRLNLSRVIYSSEYLKDTAKNVILNDSYLENDLPAELALHKGTPPFIKTFTDRGNFSANTPIVVASSTFLPGTDLQASLSILLARDENGLVEYDGVSDFRKNKGLSLYSGLKVVSKKDSGADVELSTLCDDRNSSLSIKFIEHYFPDRELRTDNYLDYNRWASVIVKSGNAKLINGSDIIKSIDEDWRDLKVGYLFTIPSLNTEYQILSVINNDTLKLNVSFSNPTGPYEYIISTVPASLPEVLLSHVIRRIVISSIEHFFSDPDPDPTPINPGGAPSDYPADEPGSPDYQKRNASKLYKQNSILSYDHVTYTVVGPTATQDNPIGTVFNPGTPGILSTGDVSNSWDEFIPDLGGDLVLVPMKYYNPDSEVLYRVRWRNWDQDITALSMGTIEEPILNIMDDLGEGIKKYYWNVSTQALEEHLFFGSIIETSSLVSASVLATDYVDGLILITNPDDLINPVGNGLNDTNYELRDTVIRELLQDGTFQVNVIREFIRL